jgi:hypothetical protein
MQEQAKFHEALKAQKVSPEITSKVEENGDFKKTCKQAATSAVS